MKKSALNDTLNRLVQAKLRKEGPGLMQNKSAFNTMSSRGAKDSVADPTQVTPAADGGAAPGASASK